MPDPIAERLRELGDEFMALGDGRLNRERHEQYHTLADFVEAATQAYDLNDSLFYVPLDRARTNLAKALGVEDA